MQLSDILRQFNLEEYYDVFARNNVTVERLKDLPMQEYSAFGVVDSVDRQQLFQAIQHIKRTNPSKYDFETASHGVSSNGSAQGRFSDDLVSAQMRDLLEEDDFIDTNKENDFGGWKRETTVIAMTDHQSHMEAMRPQPTIRQHKSRIVVAIRKRPLSSSESQSQQDIIRTDNETELIIAEPKQKVDLTKYTCTHRFHFDEVFAEQASNMDVYQRTAASLVDTVFEGGYATCFAYGQTGSGKTFTMMGGGSQHGLYVLAAEDIIARLDTRSHYISASFYEIYAGKLFDLLNDRNKLRALEDNKQAVNIVGLTEHPINNVQHLMNIIDNGNRLRSQGSTGANDTSSRSHAILVIQVRNQSNHKLFGKFSFIDLAGSERGADTMECDRQTRLEGAQINKSLLALKECIRSLDQNHKHVPFRGSKLTEVLRDSFVGNCRTVMIGAVTPGNQSCEHTLNTLRYADRVKELRRNPSDRVAADEIMMGANPTEIVETVMEKKDTRPNLVSGPSSQGMGMLGRKSSMVSSSKATPTPTPLHPSTVKKASTPLLNTGSFSSTVSATAGANSMLSHAKPMTPTVAHKLAPPKMLPSSHQGSNSQPASGPYQGTAVPIRKRSIGRQSTVHGPQVTAAQHNASHYDPSPFVPVPSGGWDEAIQMTQVNSSTDDEDEYSLQARHDIAIQQVLKAEEECIGCHRTYLDSTMEVIKSEFAELNKLDQPQSSVDGYVHQMEGIVDRKLKELLEFKEKIHSLKRLLAAEEELSRINNHVRLSNAV